MNRAIVNATAPLEIEVVAQDIRGAKPLDGHRCAFARACRRENPELIDVTVYKTVAILEYKDRFVRYNLPPSMRSEVVALDRGGRFAAGTYRLSPPPPSHSRKPIGKTAGQKGGAGANQFRHITVMVRGAP